MSTKKKKTHREKLPAKPASVLGGLLSLLRKDCEGEDSPAMKRVQTDIEGAVAELVELARTKDIPHEVWEILCRLREKANGDEFRWFEKHSPSVVVKGIHTEGRKP